MVSNDSHRAWRSPLRRTKRKVGRHRLLPAHRSRDTRHVTGSVLLQNVFARAVQWARADTLYSFLVVHISARASRSPVVVGLRSRLGAINFWIGVRPELPLHIRHQHCGRPSPLCVLAREVCRSAQRGAACRTKRQQRGCFADGSVLDICRYPEQCGEFDTGVEPCTSVYRHRVCSVRVRDESNRCFWIYFRWRRSPDWRDRKCKGP